MSRKVALIFGGSRGIGAACVDAFAKDGYDVAYTYVTSLPQDPSRPAARVRGYAVDVRQPAQVENVFAEVEHDFGTLPQCIVANAGINVPAGPLAQFDRANFMKLVDVNVVGAFNVLSEAARRVPDGGTIIALSTSMVRLALPGGGPYTASKAVVESLIRSLSKELAARNVRVNAVAPGPVDTELFHAGKTEEVKARSAALSPFNRVGHAAEVAAVVCFLASDESSWVNGQVLQPNGGMV